MRLLPALSGMKVKADEHERTRHFPDLEVTGEEEALAAATTDGCHKGGHICIT